MSKAPLRVGIDSRFYNESGVGRYLRNLIKNLQNLDNKNKYFIFLLDKDLNQFSETKNFQKVSADFNWYGFAEQFKFPKLLKKYKLDLVHFPHFNVPIFYSGKFIVTIHDLIHQHFQMKRATTLNPFTFKIKQIGYKRVFKYAVTKSSKILVPSNSVKELLESEWKVNSNKIIVTAEAVDNKLVTAVTSLKQGEERRILNKLNVKSPYIFYVGNAHPHKNVEGLIKAFLHLRKKYQYLQLVLSGNDHYFWQAIKNDFQYKDIIYTGFITDQELVVLYKNAQCFVMPSFEEGFGIPLLEAMACGCPVISSSATSLLEVGGAAAVYFSPNSPGEMIKKIASVLNSENLRKELVLKGKERAKFFSWKKLAEQTLEVYKQCG